MEQEKQAAIAAEQKKAAQTRSLTDTIATAPRNTNPAGDALLPAVASPPLPKPKRSWL